jgi:gamma-glutamylcyclotransferase (GGCT)/AIG2-like uncharacterized protein YtfP
MEARSPCSVFVYGTLQRGEERERCWPHAPLSIEAAEIRAALFDLGDYPAIIAGDDRVAGELWHFAADHIEATLRALDEIECFGQGGVDLYFRRLVTCRLPSGESTEAHTYFLASEADARKHQRVLADNNGVCRWHRFR